VPSDTKVCPSCGERVQAAAERCWHCHSDLPAVTGQPSAEPGAHEEVLLRDAKDLRKPLRTSVLLLVVILVAYGAIRGIAMLEPQHHPQPRSAGFNIFVKIQNACDEDDGDLVTTDTHGTPMAFPTPDGPERYWCVSRRYLTSIGHGPQDPLPPVSQVPSSFKWRWPSTTYGK
jgi:hypothetical protein